MNTPNTSMIDFLKRNDYDIELDNGSMSIAKHKNNPWNHFNEFIAKPESRSVICNLLTEQHKGEHHYDTFFPAHRTIQRRRARFPRGR